MRKSLVITFLVLVGAAVAWPAAAQDCQVHNSKATWKGAALVDPGDFDWCAEFNLVGTLNGLYKICYYFDDLLTSDYIYGDGWGQIETSYYYSWIETKDGSLELREWGWWDGDFGSETGFAKIVSGTGAFEGAFGTLGWPYRIPARGYRWTFEGYICTP